MELNLNPMLAENYHSSTQIARVMTESWVAEQVFCPRCGHPRIRHFPNNKPVADFFCPACNAEYELKSKNGSLGKKVNDGTYETMIARITGNHNPDFLFMGYSRQHLQVRDLFFVPRFFFVPEIIERRKPLPPTARRAGWVGCNILIEKIPPQGRISIIDKGKVVDKESVVHRARQSNFLAVEDISARGWLMDVLNCVNQIPQQVFSLKEVYVFEPELAVKHPDNHNIQAKIRQQLQLLRDRGVLRFLGNGQYEKIF